MKLKAFACVLFSCAALTAQEKFPDGTSIPDWFYQTDIVKPENLGKAYSITDYGVVNDSTVVQTAKIQAVIDRAAAEGGGVVVIPAGTYLSGSLFFKPKTHLHLLEGAVLKGSDDISDFQIIDTRIEGQNLKYFAALVNADKVDGFTLSGKGTINGNGLRFWRSFWLRRKVIPKCTNMDELRPRLVHISHSNDVQLSGVRLINSPFWTTHLYKCNRVKLLGLYIFAPAAPVKAPSSDAIDIDVCTDVLVKNCYMSVNDDAIALKGGKGPWADTDPNNGANRNILIEDCTYGFCHSALTCGSESVFNHNILLRRIRIDHASRLLWLKMRPDTPQHYEYITVEDIKGSARAFLYIRPWTQFFDLKDRKDAPMSYSDHITMRNIELECDVFFNVNPRPDQYKLTNFTFENLKIKAKDPKCDRSAVENFVWKNVVFE
ncbi:MAG: exopolygalacturonase [Prevotellaceae bacterium]|jgi:polygalacturonase|nr:exopolygalacturonase [Prevotellaceae bacterium]